MFPRKPDRTRKVSSRTPRSKVGALPVGQSDQDSSKGQKRLIHRPTCPDPAGTRPLGLRAPARVRDADPGKAGSASVCALAKDFQTLLAAWGQDVAKVPQQGDDGDTWRGLEPSWFGHSGQRLVVVPGVPARLFWNVLWFPGYKRKRTPVRFMTFLSLMAAS